MTLDVRYARSFLYDLMSLEQSAYLMAYNFAFIQFKEIKHLHDLPELRPLGSSAIFYRFTLEDFLVGIEVKGQIVKFVRILPKPNI